MTQHDQTTATTTTLSMANDQQIDHHLLITISKTLSSSDTSSIGADNNISPDTPIMFPSVVSTIIEIVPTTSWKDMNNLSNNDEEEDDMIDHHDDDTVVADTVIESDNGIYHFHSHDVDDLDEQQLDDLYYNDVTNLHHMMISGGTTPANNIRSIDEHNMDEDEYEPLMMDGDDDVLVEHHNNEDNGFRNSFRNYQHSNSFIDTKDDDDDDDANNNDDHNIMMMRRPRSISLSQSPLSSSLSTTDRSSNLNDAMIDHHPHAPVFSSSSRSNSLPKLSSPIDKLLHQPFHGRQPSVINEEIYNDNKYNKNDHNDNEEDDDDLEQEESLKYSGGLEVLQRITSQQEFMNHNNDNISTKLSPIRQLNNDPSQHYSNESLPSSPLSTLRRRRNNGGIIPSNDIDIVTIPSMIQDHHNKGTIIGSTTTCLYSDPSSSSITPTIIRSPIDTLHDNKSVPKVNNNNSTAMTTHQENEIFVPYYTSTYYLNYISKLILNRKHYNTSAAVTWISFWAMLLVTCANHILTPMRDAIALQVGVHQIPKLTLISTVLAFFSSVPIGWLFEAPDPNRRLIWKTIGLTRGDTQGTSLALFYRIFAIVLLSYAIGFSTIDMIIKYYTSQQITDNNNVTIDQNHRIEFEKNEDDGSFFFFTNNIFSKITDILSLWSIISQCLYIAFFLVVHLMKLHCLSLIWGVATEAIEYEEENDTINIKKSNSNNNINNNNTNTNDNSTNSSNSNTANSNINDNHDMNHNTSQKLRLEKLSFISFGGTMGSIFGSILASCMANILKLPGLLLLSAILLEISAELSIELGTIMQKHWMKQQALFIQKQQEQQEKEEILLRSTKEQQQHNNSNSNSINCSLDNNGVNTSSSLHVVSNQNNTPTLDSSMKRSVSLGSMKRVASGNSLHRVNSNNSLKSVKSASDLHGNGTTSGTSLSSMNTETTDSNGNTILPQKHDGNVQLDNESKNADASNNGSNTQATVTNEDTFRQRLLRGIYTIFRSRLLMAIFTYNALYASTNVLLSFQRAALVANRTTNMDHKSVQADTAFLANINMASSIAIFALQASGIGASVAHICGPRGTLSLMPIVRLLGVAALAYWHHTSNGQTPNLLMFLILDEFCKVMNLAIAKPVRESLWRGLSNEARYEAKPIVDTIANRWGGGSAAFLVAFIDRTLLHYHKQRSNDTNASSSSSSNPSLEIFGFPPILFLCIIIATWWTIVSADLGQIRKNIDIELKKRQ